uniref:Uncharacterized protein n=1 Tax=Arundo donax TaxID=35708 RepID=A0A0A9G9I8_ARUDO
MFPVQPQQPLYPRSPAATPPARNDDGDGVRAPQVGGRLQGLQLRLHLGAGWSPASVSSLRPRPELRSGCGGWTEILACAMGKFGGSGSLFLLRAFCRTRRSRNSRRPRSLRSPTP